MSQAARKPRERVWWNRKKASPAPAKNTGGKGKSKSRCQRRIWSFSLPRFMRSHSSPKLNSDSMPSEESRSSTLPRLKSADDTDLSAAAKGGDAHLFKITSLTSLHDLPGDAAPRTCFSQGGPQPGDDFDKNYSVPTYRRSAAGRRFSLGERTFSGRKEVVLARPRVTPVPTTERTTAGPRGLT
ncbi:hypothetical protein MRX96_027692 [Rhipicephalus microplus]